MRGCIIRSKAVKPIETELHNMHSKKHPMCGARFWLATTPVRKVRTEQRTRKYPGGILADIK